MLGPLLFLAYIDGVARSVHRSKVIMYDDDIVLYRIIKNPSDFSLLQEDVTSICTWVTNNHLTLNSQKSCYMLFSRKSHPTVPATNLYTGECQPLTRVSHYKYLSQNFSEDLSWSHHIQQQCKKSRKLIGILFRNFYAYCNVHTLYVLFKTVIMPHLEYGCVVWDPHLLKDKTACLFSMSERRVQLKLLTLFNMVKGNILLPPSPLQPRNIPYAIRPTSAHSPYVPSTPYVSSTLFFLLPSPAGMTSLLTRQNYHP